MVGPKEPLLTETSRGKERSSGRAVGKYDGTLELDASQDERFLGVKEFWVHLTMVNGCAKATRTSNKITAYGVEAQAAGH